MGVSGRRRGPAGVGL
ncbi:hypothetical protein MZD37_22640 [Escherichia coli]|nr:hypothetical protein [Escherichia coli]MCQ6157025.1 hypothetical protein [Escherichia coli]MDI1197445.1 hypothetical protein [Escherichia coli]